MASIRIESREELIYLLSEASELEHLLACSYLFAAFTLKTTDADGLTAPELQAVRGWHRSILDVAIEEMLHLAVVSNLLTAVGGAPNLHRPNLPQMSRYYPTDIQLDLAPFDEQTARHFAYLERPEGSDEEDAPFYREAALQAAAIEVTAVQVVEELGVVGRPQGYRAIGGLYRGIEYGFREMAARLGEASLFIGPARAQVSSKQVHFRELQPVTDLGSALAAIQIIVEQGEGLRANKEGTHYWRFIEIEKQYSQLKRIRPDFAPARSVLRNPFTRLPTDVAGVNLLDDPGSVAVCDLFNGAYEVIVQLLMRFFANLGETAEEMGALIDSAIELMSEVIMPVGEYLTTLPAGPRHPGLNAGPSFQFFRSTQLLPHKAAAWHVLGERLQSLAIRADQLADPESPALRTAGDALRGLAGRLESGRAAQQ